MAEQHCETCRFGVDVPPSPDLVECRRRAPVVFPGTAPMWPKVSIGDWCGEWEEGSR